MENVPVSTNDPTPMGRHTTDRPNNHQKRKKPSKKIVGAVVGVILLVAVALAGWSIYRSGPAAHIDDSKYQAVFFTNGQVYFGKLHKLGGSYFSLTDIFYIQSKTAQGENESENPQKAGTDSTSDLQLIKLGSEVHGPADEMVISKEQILFFENLRSDGKVADTITKYHSQKK